MLISSVDIDENSSSVLFKINYTTNSFYVYVLMYIMLIFSIKNLLSIKFFNILVFP